MRRRPMTLAVLLALAALGGCGEGEGDGDPAAAGEARTETAPADLTDTRVKPEIEKPTGSPPRRLETEDIVKGSGRPAKRGDTVTVHYVGVSFSNGEQFDASWDSGQPFSFRLGAGRVIPGWDRGVAGMRVGGRRKLTIPPELAYGARGVPPEIAPNETLIFVVDLVKIG